MPEPESATLVAPSATAPAEPGPAAAAPAAPAARGRRWRLALAVAVAVALALEAGLIALAASGGWYEPQLRVAAPTAAPAAVPAAEAEAASPHARLAAAFPELAPRGVYLVVDTYGNRLRIYRGGELLREAVCSTGSGTVLRDPVGGRLWVFDTPLGERRVQRKTREPVWIKPDWAFVELGYEPPKEFRERVDDLSLGRYGLYLGDGYIIHGTLFQTLLGRALTHGCVRLGDEDLEYVYRQTPVGARVFLY